MIKNECKNHEWEKTGDYRVNENFGFIPTPFTCKNCQVTMTASEVFQLEALENQTKATSALVITTIVAFSTLVIVTIGFYIDYIK